MFALTELHQFYLLNQPTDMRGSFDALSGKVLNVLGRNPISGEVFIFVNRHKNRMKLLQWQSGGFVLYYKRLEKGTFSVFDKTDPGQEVRLSYTDLTMLIYGIERRNIQKTKRFCK